MENGRRNRMFPDVLVLSFEVGRAPRDKAMRFAHYVPRLVLIHFHILSLAKQKTVPLPILGMGPKSNITTRGGQLRDDDAAGCECDFRRDA